MPTLKLPIKKFLNILAVHLSNLSNLSTKSAFLALSDNLLGGNPFTKNYTILLFCHLEST